MKKFMSYIVFAVSFVCAYFLITRCIPERDSTGVQIGPEPSDQPDASEVDSVPAGCSAGDRCSTPKSYCFTRAGDYSSPKLDCTKVGDVWQWQSPTN